MVWYKNINNCKYMFRSCSDITEIDMSNFDSSQVIEMNSIFSECISLTSINLSNFDTSQNTNFGGLFYDCILLTSLNLSTFNTSKATYMARIFHGCTSLVSIDIKNFDTSQAENMKEMFYNCSSLTSLDLSDFDTSKVIDMNNMFYNCSSLSSLNLSNFNNQNVQDMTKMFYGCVHLEYINLKNFVLESYPTDSLYNTPENIVICINDQYNTFINNLNSACLIIDCSDDWKLNQKKIIDKNGTCIDSCIKDYTYKFEYNGKCYQNCKDGFFTDDNNITNKCKCELEQCSLCPPVALEKNLCSKCNINYYPKEDDPLNIGEYINCYRNPEGYYLDKNDSVYKKCYSSCETCDKKGDYLINNNIENNYTNCYEKCDYYHFFDDKYNFQCTSNYSCPKEYPILVQSKKECIIYESDIIKGIDNIKDFQEIINIINTKTNGTKFKGKDEKIEYYNTILQDIESIFTNDNYNTTNLENGKEDIIKIGEMAVTFTSTQNQKKNINDNKNKTAINLGECETLLKEYYKIPDNKELYIKMIEVNQEGMKIPKIEYDIYYKLQGTNLIKLNLTICEKSKISLYMPIKIDKNENIDKFNSSSGYYNDICYKTSSDYGTDISLKDRRNIFIEDNKTACQDDCIFKEYNYITQKANCLCEVKRSSFSFADIYINKNKLYANFINIKNIANLNILKCKRQLFNLQGLLYNIGSYITISVNIFHIISFFIFCIRQYHIFLEQIKDIVYAIKNLELIKQKNDDKRNLNKNKKMDIKNFSNNNRNLLTTSTAKKNKKEKKRKKYKVKTEVKDSKNINIQSLNLNFNNNIFSNVIKSKKKNKKIKSNQTSKIQMNLLKLDK